MSKREWGNATWYLFHTLAEKLKPEFSGEASELFRQIKLLCGNLPCPECSQHATSSLNAVNMNSINSRENLIEFIWQFHNRVNGRTGKSQYTREECRRKYSCAITRIILSNFISVFKMNARNDKAMMHSYRRHLSTRVFEKYIYANTHKYYG
jgi:hypothetical protein|tara:strand:- start:747 stop:1202 length:456 start_codon:yes stop_codon:yes gene_type:complete